MKLDPATALPRRLSPGAAGARLAALYEEHARMVLGVCRLVLRDSDEAEDATQQVFLSAYRSLLAGTEPRNPGAWLGTIARNESRGRIAARHTRPVVLVGDRERGSVTLEEQAGARAEFAELRDELAILPEKQREAVVLRDLYGLRYDEVARALGISRPAVEALLFRGRKRLQRRLRPEIAAGVLVVPLALRESIAYAVPGFAAGGASTAGVLAKLTAVPLAAKLAAAGATVGVAGTAGVIAERELQEPPRRPVAALVERVTGVQPAAVIPVGLAPAGLSRADEEEGADDEALWEAREDAEDRDEPEEAEDEEAEDVEARDVDAEVFEAEDGDRRVTRAVVEPEGDDERLEQHDDTDDAAGSDEGDGPEADAG